MPGAMDDSGAAGEPRGDSSPAGRHRPGERALPPRPGPEPPGRGGPLPGDLPRASPRPPYLQTLAARRTVALCDRGSRRGAAHAPAPDPDGEGDSGGLAPGTGDGGQWAWETHVGTGARSSAPDAPRGHRAREARGPVDRGRGRARGDDAGCIPRARPSGVPGAPAAPGELKRADASEPRAPGRPAPRRRTTGPSSVVTPHATGGVARPAGPDARLRRRVRSASGPRRSPSSAALPARGGSVDRCRGDGGGGGAARRGSRDGRQPMGGGALGAARRGGGADRVPHRRGAPLAHLAHAADRHGRGVLGDRRREMARSLAASLGPTGGAVMRRLAAPIVLAFSLSFVSVGYAAQEEPKVTLEAMLDVADEVPSPTGTLPGAGGPATFEYDETDKTIAYTVTVTDLTGPPLAAHIHPAPPGMPGPSRITLDQNNLAGGAPPLPVPEDLVEPLYDGGTYVNVHTAQNPSGEVRGQ